MVLNDIQRDRQRGTEDLSYVE